MEAAFLIGLVFFLIIFGIGFCVDGTSTNHGYAVPAKMKEKDQTVSTVIGISIVTIGLVLCFVLAIYN